MSSADYEEFPCSLPTVSCHPPPHDYHAHPPFHPSFATVLLGPPAVIAFTRCHRSSSSYNHRSSWKSSTHFTRSLPHESMMIKLPSFDEKSYNPTINNAWSFCWMVLSEVGGDKRGLDEGRELGRPDWVFVCDFSGDNFVAIIQVIDLKWSREKQTNLDAVIQRQKEKSYDSTINHARCKPTMT
ncbi:hypothetical protein HJC23_002985 [Cyclotella cryptica]|uniref:Uncharacterized protein n=1 Tax=Cyclotella cryptica TaxID=29204 RepID=A0ABD3P769_9STRA